MYSTVGECSDAALDQDGQARQPVIVGLTEEDYVAYYKDLKDVHPSS